MDNIKTAVISNVPYFELEEDTTEQEITQRNANNRRLEDKKYFKCKVIASLLVGLIFVVVVSAIALGFTKKMALPVIIPHRDKVHYPVIMPHNNSLAKISYNYTFENASRSCVTPQCKERMSRMSQMMDLTADPCQDFYQYACGGNFKETLPASLQKEYAPVMWYDVISDKLSSDLIEAFSTTNSSKSTFWEAHGKAKQLFKSCMNKNNASNAAVLRSISQEFGGFRLRKDDSRPVLPFAESLALAYTYTSGIFFNLEFGVEMQRPPTATFVVKLSPNWLSDQIATSLATIAKMVSPSSEIGLFNSEEIDNAVKISGKMETLLLEILSPSEHFDMSDNSTILTPIAELDGLCNQINWQNLFSKISKSAQLDDEKFSISTVALNPVMEAYLKKLCDLVKEYSATAKGRRAMHNFIVYKVASSLYDADQLSSDSISCMSLTIASLPFAVGSFAELSLLNMAAARPKLTAMLAELWKQFLKDVNSSTGLSNETKSRLEGKLRTLHYEIGFADWTANKTLLNDYHRKFVATSSSINNSINAYRFVVGQWLKAINVPAEDVNLPRSVLEVNAMLDLDANKIFLLSAIAQPNFFDYNYPDLLNFAGLGYILAHELNHILGEENFFDDQYLFERKSCVSSFYANFSRDGSGYDRSSRTVRDDMADIGGTTLAYRVYKSLIAPLHNWGDDEIHPPGLGLNADQIFFVTTAQNNCVYVKDQSSLFRGFYDHSPGPYRVNGTMANIDEFSSAFNCPTFSPMNPATKCRLL